MEKFLDFGTAGIRGIIGEGPSKLNYGYVKQIANGIVQYLNNDKKNSKLVVIGRDNRLMSEEFSIYFANFLTKNGINVIFNEEISPTPFVSFLILKHKASLGINITASHNPAEYNGIKLYNSKANQLLPEEVFEIKKYFDEYVEIKNVDKIQLNKNKFLHLVSINDKNDYINKVINVANLNKNNKKISNLKVVYSPLHGTGIYFVPTILEKIFIENNYLFADKQMVKDPYFTYAKKPNPELEEVFYELISVAKNKDIDLLLVTDPDSDRIGVAVSHKGEFRLLNGNETALIIFNYLLENNFYNQNSSLVYSFVSSPLLAKIASSKKLNVIEVPTGFKWMGDVINKEKLNSVFAFEESYGSLIEPSLARDKDAIQSVVAISFIASELKNQNLSLVDYLDKIYKKYGYIQSQTISYEFGDVKKIDSIREEFSKLTFCEQIQDIKDYKHESIPSDMIKITLIDKSTISYRPSGTEPKIKFYIYTYADDESEAKKKLESITKSLDKFIFKFK
ncbi:phospho-sugar mutase [Mycoplasmopsis anatis]|uniref:Phosphomannomutase n=1 Tax=Mycoplasmopsis anatis 1340 TaxID=1034808 RepID=F9QCZ3_9BACT|nr:phospho-sugar mutase [Mycoplasmopsis anatis]AWX70482.1 phospho-sugar mutase [Mycoplasmopsis anatis]EGS29375.1 phosphomannomutase [Mycoplasmopsis anatis 1340]VEU73854.1 Phosphoglucomutase [Mycoplasmopsis anatis]